VRRRPEDSQGRARQASSIKSSDAGRASRRLQCPSGRRCRPPTPRPYPLRPSGGAGAPHPRARASLLPGRVTRPLFLIRDTFFLSARRARARRRVFAASESLGRSGGRGGGNLERPIVGDEPLLGRCCAVASASLALRLPVDLLNPLSWPSRGSTFVTGPTFVPRGLRIR
jgi:hypothetical protein